MYLRKPIASGFEFFTISFGCYFFGFSILAKPYKIGVSALQG